MRDKDEGSELRLFVACELPPEMKAALTALQDALRRQGAPPVRWVRPEGIHLTLKFLGAVPAQRVSDICAALAPTVEGIRPLGLSLGSLGAFGGRRGARVVWVGVEGDIERVSELQRRVEAALARLVGAERILFGSDFPLIGQRRQRQAIEEAFPADEPVRALILGENVRRLLRLEP